MEFTSRQLLCLGMKTVLIKDEKGLQYEMLLFWSEMHCALYEHSEYISMPIIRDWHQGATLLGNRSTPTEGSTAEPWDYPCGHSWSGLVVECHSALQVGKGLWETASQGPPKEGHIGGFMQGLHAALGMPPCPWVPMALRLLWRH